MKTKTIGFIGGGRITKIFLQGFKNEGIEFPSIHVYDIDKSTLSALESLFPEIKVSNSISEAAKQEIVFIALHPPVIAETVGQLKGVIKDNSLIISLAPKFNIEKLSLLTDNKRIVRMIPNATSFINQGYNPICFSEVITEIEKKSILEVLNVLGKTFETEESKLESYAIASAMLPTYFWFQWKEMENIAKEIGLTDLESRDSVYESLKAALEMMYKSDLVYEELTEHIPIKPIGEKESEIKHIFNSTLVTLFNKIKPS